MIKEKKINLSNEHLYKSLLFDEFAIYINYARSLNFEDRSDYIYLYKIFRRGLKGLNTTMYSTRLKNSSIRSIAKPTNQCFLRRRTEAETSVTKNSKERFGI